jgi:hypothetical protein
MNSSSVLVAVEFRQEAMSRRDEVFIPWPVM